VNRLPPKFGTVKIMKNVLLVDGNALFKQAYHGAKDVFTSKSKHGEIVHVGGLYQFLFILRNFLFDNSQFKKVYVFWDGKLSGQKRYALYPEYKSNRNKDYVNGNIPEADILLQIELIREYLFDLSIRQFWDDIIEGDDFIGYYCINKPEDEQITIFTSDRDMCQLLSDDVRVYLIDIKRMITKANYREHFKHHSENALLVKMICGDKSDSIKGVKGVGEKTLLNLMPEIADRKVTLQEVLIKAREDNDKRKKPLQSNLNILEQRTDGSQGNRLYDINRIIMDLKNPLMDERVLDDFHSWMENAITPKVDGFIRVYTNLRRDGINDLISEYNKESFFLPFKKITNREKEFYNKSN
jgi:5'-3' exonuclease